METNDKDIKNVSSVNDIQVAAVIAGASIAAAFLLYWAVQVQSVREMLALAYGG